MNKIQTDLLKSLTQWLWDFQYHPEGLGLNIGTFLQSEHADLGALWLRSHSGNNPGIGKPHSALFICCPTREQCWSESANGEEMAKQLVLLKNRKEQLQAEIRKNEPELRDTETLYEEFAFWKYELSTNPEYHTITKQINDLEQALFKGTRMDHISKKPIANKFYLVVPQGILTPNEICEDWGLITISENQITLEKKAFKHTISREYQDIFLKRLLQCNTKLTLKTIENTRGKSKFTPRSTSINSNNKKTQLTLNL